MKPNTHTPSRLGSKARRIASAIPFAAAGGTAFPMRSLHRESLLPARVRGRPSGMWVGNPCSMASSYVVRGRCQVPSVDIITGGGSGLSVSPGILGSATAVFPAWTSPAPVTEVLAGLGVAVDAGQGAEPAFYPAPLLAGLLESQGGAANAAKHVEYFELMKNSHVRKGFHVGFIKFQ